MTFATTAVRRGFTSFAVLALVSAVMLGVACNKTANASYKDSVKASLEQADLKDVTVSENAEKNTITLGGNVHSRMPKLERAVLRNPALVLASSPMKSAWNR